MKIHGITKENANSLAKAVMEWEMNMNDYRRKKKVRLNKENKSGGEDDVVIYDVKYVSHQDGTYVSAFIHYT